MFAPAALEVTPRSACPGLGHRVGELLAVGGRRDVVSGCGGTEALLSTPLVRTLTFCLHLSRIDRNVTAVRAPVALVLAMSVVVGCATKADADDSTGLPRYPRQAAAPEKPWERIADGFHHSRGPQT